MVILFQLENDGELNSDLIVLQIIANLAHSLEVRVGIV